jgi:hypothetical protein
MRTNHFRLLLILVFTTGIFIFSTATAFGEVSVLKVDTLVVEKGATLYTITLKVFVKNIGEATEAKVDVVALDREGFELENATLSGSLKQDQTKVFVDIIKMPKETYVQIDKWEWKK